MVKIIFTLLFLLFATIASEIQLEEGVLVLNEDNFDEALEEYPKLLVEFYAPWCGHCKTLAPEWAKAAKTLADGPIKLAKVDATENNGLAEKFGVKGFPTIKYINDKKTSDYSGGRTENDIVSWAEKRSGPPAKTISSADELLKFQEAHEVFTIGVFSSITSDAAKQYLAIASSDETTSFAITTDETVKSSLGVTKDTIIVLKNFDEKRNDLELEESMDKETITEFILGSSTPLIQTFSPEASKKLFSSPINKHVLIFTNKAADHHTTTLETYRSVAESFKGKFLFINVPHSENRVLEFFGLKETDVPTMVLSDMGGESGLKKYPFTAEHESSAVTAFLQSFMSGDLKPHLKSEKAAPSDTAGPVVILKGETFEDLVINNEKDVLVEFYAPWCGHCKELAPKYEKLGEQMAAYENIVIAKMDSTANEIDRPGVNVKGFPTLLFFKGNNKTKPIPYEGAREVDAMAEFIKKHAHNSIDHDEL